jgi:hypothetical protein
MGPGAHMDVAEKGINSCSCLESNSAVVQPMLMKTACSAALPCSDITLRHEGTH